jgi:hypothetical protein
MAQFKIVSQFAPHGLREKQSQSSTKVKPQLAKIKRKKFLNMSEDKCCH